MCSGSVNTIRISIITVDTLVEAATWNSKIAFVNISVCGAHRGMLFVPIPMFSMSMNMLRTSITSVDDIYEYS